MNVVATKNLASYLTTTINRLCLERLQDRTDDIVKGNNQFNSRWAIAFREGIVDAVVDKIQERREEALAEEERAIKKAARAAKRAGSVVSQALTLTTVKERETQANYDFIHGEGAWARKKAAEEEREKRWAEYRAESAKAEQEAEEAYAQWAVEHPEAAEQEAERLIKQERKRDAARRRRLARGGGWGRSYFRETNEDKRHDSGAYRAGREAGKSISIEPQVDGGRKRISHAN